MPKLNTAPFVFLLLPLILGIVTGYHCAVFPLGLWIGGGLMVLILGIGSWLWKAQRRLLGLLALGLLVGIMGCASAQYKMRQTEFPESGKEQTYQAHIQTVPLVKGKSIRCQARLQGVFQEDSCQNLTQTVQLSFYKDSAALQLKQGDMVQFHAPIDLAATGNPEDFRYDRYLRLQGLSGTAYCAPPTWQKTGHKDLLTLRAKAEQCQHFLVERFRNLGIEQEPLSILSALFLGYRGELEVETRQTFSAAGAMHVLAVSGLHVGIIYGILLFLLTGCGLFPIQYHQKRRRIINAVVVIVCLWLYAFLTGLSASVMRSCLMFSLLCLGESLDRMTNTYNTIAASAVILLLLNPLLLYSISFILSYSAVVAIVTLEPPLSRLLPIRLWPFSKIWDLLCLSVAAQIGTLPWTLYWFGQTSNYFALTNLVVVPAAGILIGFALIVLVFSGFSWGIWLAKGLNGALQMLYGFVSWIEHLPGSTFTVSITQTMLWCLWGVILCAVVAGLFRKWQPALGSLGCGLLLGICVLVQLQKTQQTEVLMAYNTAYDLLVYQHGRDLTLFTTDSAQAVQKVKLLQGKRLLKKPQIVDISQEALLTFRYKEQDFLWVRDTVLQGRQWAEAVHADRLLLSQIGRVSPERLNRLIQADEWILMPTMRRYKTEQIKQWSEQNQKRCQEVRQAVPIW